MSGFLARWLSRVGLGRASAAFGYGTKPSGAAPVLVPIPGCAALAFKPTAIAAITFEPTATATLAFRPTATATIAFKGC